MQIKTYPLRNGETRLQAIIKQGKKVVTSNVVFATEAYNEHDLPPWVEQVMSDVRTKAGIVQDTEGLTGGGE